MTRQDQSVDEGGEGYQAGRDLTVNQAMSAGQMTELLMAMAKQLSAYTEDANAKVDERLREFREDIVKEFSNTSDAQRAAFNEPDFQFTLEQAQTTYARAGGDELRSELVRLLVEKSSRPTEDRLSFILTEAIKICGQMTKEDRSLIVVLFVIKTIIVKTPAISMVYSRLSNLLAHHVDRLPTTITSFEYLESLGCVNIERVADYYPLKENLARQYSELFPKKRVPGPPISGQSEPPMIEMPVSPDEIFQEFQSKVPELDRLLAVWDNLLFRHTVLTSLGKALAHSILTGEGKMDASLEVFLG